MKDYKATLTLLFKKGDKGAGIVIMDLCDYQNKIENMLSDTQTYTTINQDKTLQTKEKADNAIYNLYKKGYLTKKQLNYFTNFEPKCPIFYGIPKIHKPNVPLRPIVSQINGPTSKLNELVDFYLTEAEKQIPYLLQDTTSFINLINKQKDITDKTILVTLDVVSLYTNIPNDEGIDYVCEFYEETLESFPQIDPFPKLLPKIELQKLLHIILYNTLFTFNNKYYEQNYGCTMGAKASVKYANIYMHKFLSKFTSNYTNYIPKFLARLVDDIFTLWQSSLESLLLFVDTLNKIHNTIKFELNYSYKEITFLDTIVYKDGNSLKTKPYIKPTDKKQYLHYNSCHPSHIFKSIPYSQAIRYKRIISDDNLLEDELNKLKKLFLVRNYPENKLTKVIDKVKGLSRSETLTYKTKEQKQVIFKEFLKGSDFLPLTLIYHPTLTQNKSTNIKFYLQDQWKQLLSNDDNLKHIFVDSHPTIIFKNHNTIANKLITARFPNTKLKTNRLSKNIDSPLSNPETHKCKHIKCKCCNYIIPYYHLNNKTLQTLQIPHVINLNCNTNNLIYLINCNKCNLQYIGQTSRKLKERFTDHFSNIKTHKNTPIAIHFNQPSHTINNFTISPLETIPHSNQDQLLKKEKFWIKTLKTQYPKGLNYYPIDKNHNPNAIS